MHTFRFWIFVAVIGLSMSVTVRIISEMASGDARKYDFLEGQVNIINERLIKIESKSHPATSDRFTRHNADAMELRLIECVDAGTPIRECVAEKKAKDKN